MTEYFKALEDFKPSPRKDNYYIVVDNMEIVSLCRDPKEHTVKITMQNYKFLLDNGIENFIYKGAIEKKPKKRTSRAFPLLVRQDMGYDLQDHDPHWPTEIVKGGYQWQTPSE